MKKLLLTSTVVIMLFAMVVFAQTMTSSDTSATAATSTEASAQPAEDCWSYCKRTCVEQKISDEDCAKMCEQKCAPQPTYAEPEPVTVARVRTAISLPAATDCPSKCKHDYIACEEAKQDGCREHYAYCLKSCQQAQPVPRPLPPVARELHYKCYEVQEIRADVKLPEVRVDDQFGTEYLKVLRPQLLCTPAWKEVIGEDVVRDDATVAASLRTPAVSVAALPASQATPGIPAWGDHLKCYEIEEIRADVHYPEVRVTDQFGVEYLRILKPRLLCTPARKQHVDREPVRPVRPVEKREMRPEPAVGEAIPPSETPDKARPMAEDVAVPQPAMPEDGFWMRLRKALFG